ncbi:hypothetical protein [Nocardia sp. bgisy118]|uniref:hypothetical protein n=1 Tax=Nocardia sp. bgisy118 TaxID=3413786 RepID=UPI003F4A1038
MATRPLARLIGGRSKSRHRKPEGLRRYFKPSPVAMRDLTASSDPVHAGQLAPDRPWAVGRVGGVRSGSEPTACRTEQLTANSAMG